MIWGICVGMDTGGGDRLYGEERSFTRNKYDAMVLHALQKSGAPEEWTRDNAIYRLNGRLCSEAGPVLSAAVDWWRKNQKEMAQFESPNERPKQGASLAFWTWVALECKDHPDAQLCVTG